MQLGLLLLALVSCSPPPVITGQVLSAGNESGQDEDPSLLRAADGQLYAAWYSNRNGQQDDGREDREIFLSRSADGVTWTEPLQVTRSPHNSFYPGLAQEPAGAFHLAVWRVIPVGLGTNNQIVHKTSADGTTWDLDQETIVAGGPGDVLPCIVHDRVADRLLVYFASPVRGADGRVDLSGKTLRLYVSVNAGTGTGWSFPQRLSGVDDDATHNTYPFVVQREDGQFLMVWTRYRAEAGSDVLAVLSEPSTETMTSTSANGLDWSEPVQVSPGGSQSVDVFPSLYAGAARSSWTALWLTAPKGSSSASTVEAALDAVLPAAAERPEITGYTAKVAPLDATGRYLGVWVAGAPGRQKIRFDVFTR